MSGTFKIVAFINKKGKSSKMQYAYVPSSWEKDEIIYWPKSGLNNERKNPDSVPAKDWFQYKGKVKKSDIFGLDEAILWEEEYLQCPNTDAEQQ